MHQINRVQLELPVPMANQAPMQTTPGAQQRSQLNQQCLIAFQQWLHAEFDLIARAYPSMAALPSIWEVVTGTALSVDSLRLVLIPTVAIAVDELRVPQEWVDIPAWAADYYLALQVDPDQQWIEIVGCASHRQLKTTGVYDAGDRTYALDPDDLNDINSLFISWQLTPAHTPLQPIPKADLAPLPALPKAQADSLLQRLGDPSVVFPRRAVPFPQWAALLAHGGWRQRLYQQRQGQPEPASVSQWIQAGVASLAQPWGWQLREFNLAGVGVRSFTTGIAKPLIIAGQTYELRVFPLGPTSDRTWRFELRSTPPGSQIPTGFKLRLLTEDLQPMENNEDTATTPSDRLFIDVILEPGEGLVWEIEPTPEECDREILWF
jgi:hypothetical protein